MPPLWIGVMMDDFNSSGTIPFSRLLFHSIISGVQSSVLQFLSRIAGKPSGPAAAELESSSIAVMKSFSVSFKDGIAGIAL